MQFIHISIVGEMASMSSLFVFILLFQVFQIKAQIKNVALSKPTNQRSTLEGGVSSRAVDGNTNGVYNGGSCTHTRQGSPSWWCIDLQQVFNNININIYNRKNNQGRIRGFEIKLRSDDQCNEQGFRSATSCYIDTPPTVQDVYTIDRCNQQPSRSLSARTVFISVTGILTLCEVEIYTAQIKNVALSKPTNQRSTLEGGVSSRAVDGNTNGVYNGGSCTHTRQGSPSWWCIDLQQVFNNININIYNRKNNQGRIRGFEIKLRSDDQCNEQGFRSATSCYIDTPPTVQDVYTIDRCNQQPSRSLSARTVFISVTGILTLCEVEIYTGCDMRSVI
ncbi:uncharacterized protein LOC126818013 [Patella vulgata]|uniref:uncharacterized protein LOC126818013 n=1 Tax=Patella vulgata TaxID=6465 RepID=UPI0024A89D92|nr:uncharacterized protein LOC126818013 [Patella vulgata]